MNYQEMRKAPTYWTVLREATRNGYLRCRCRCGKVKNVRAERYKYHLSRSCGCLKLESVRRCRNPQLAGRTFGKLTILRWAGMKKSGSQGYSSWVCKCECGKIKTIREFYILNGKIRSCGCLLYSGSAYKHGMCRTAFWRNWAIRKKRGLLPAIWQDFQNFYKDTYETYPFGKVKLTDRRMSFLARKDLKRELGPDNFEWLLKRSEETSKKSSKYFYVMGGKEYRRSEIQDILSVSRQRIQQLHVKGDLLHRLERALRHVHN